MIKYFISYSYSTDNASGFSNIQISLLKPIRSMEDITFAANKVKEFSPQIEHVVIINWQRFEEDKPFSTITPMDYDTFVTKYVSERAKAGDTTDCNILIDAYALYCADPTGHWLHKEK